MRKRFWDYFATFSITFFIQIVVAIILINYQSKPNSSEWWIFNLLSALIVFLIVWHLYNIVIRRQITPTQISKDLVNEINNSEYNFCAISSKNISLWESETVQYYLTINTLKNIQEYSKENRAFWLKISSAKSDIKKYIKEGKTILKEFSTGDLGISFNSIRFLIYPSYIYKEYKSEIEALLQTHALSRIYCIPVVKEKLLKCLSNSDIKILKDFTKKIKQKPWEVPTKTIFGCLKSNNIFPDILIIDNIEKNVDHNTWWFTKKGLEDDTNSWGEAQKVFKIICEKSTDAIWKEYDAEDTWQRVLTIEPIKEAEVIEDFFSYEYFDKWVNLIKKTSDFASLLNWFKAEEKILLEKSKDGKNIIDIGCGWGRHIIQIAEKMEYDWLIGIDKSSRQIKKGNRQLGIKYPNKPNYYLNLQNALDTIGFPENSILS